MLLATLQAKSMSMHQQTSITQQQMQKLDSKHNNLQQAVDAGELHQYRTDEIKILKPCSLTMRRHAMDEEHATQYADTHAREFTKHKCAYAKPISQMGTTSQTNAR